MVLTRRLLAIIVWIAIIGFSIYFFMDNVIAYFYGYRSRLFGNSFFNNQVWVVLHLVGGSLALLLGPTQFWSFIRNRFLNFHRLAGKLYMLGVLLIGISAGRLALISSCVPCRISLFLLTVFAVITTWFAWTAIKNRNIKAHRQMMVRSYICVLGFVAVRIDEVIPLNFLFGSIGDGTFRRVVNEYFFSFVPLIIAEIFLTWIPSVYYRKK
ncbi:MAG TPA: DUF2306 domain-containing protein [Ferruginibacter sp.]|nr:DUF2306 domain-containing protein [Ferruginibacter sp.]